MKKFTFFFIAIIFVFAFYYFLNNLTFNSKRSFTIFGADISNQYKGRLNWEKLGDSNSFIILRAVRCVDTNKIKGQHSYTCVIDTNFENNWLDLEKNKLIRGAYHRYSPGLSPKSQFEVYKNHVHLGNKDLPPILDIQAIQNNKIEINLAIEWLKMANAYYNTIPIMYLDYSSYLAIKKNSFIDEINRNYFEKIYLMVKSTEQPAIDRPFLWQYVQDTAIKGFQEKVDLIRYTGDSISFKNILIR